MRKTIATIAAGGMLGGAALIGGNVASTQAAGTIRIGDNYFIRSSGVPSTSAKRGERVLFKWVGRVSHNVVVKSGPLKFSSPTRTSGTYRTPKLKRGKYLIICSIHGQRDQSMTISAR